jgi:hypothetical protein
MVRYQVRLLGESAKLGEIPAADVGKLLTGVQSAIARAAGAAIGRQVKGRGRWERQIEDATRLRLVRLRQGSVLAEFDLPQGTYAEGELDLSAETLGDLGWRTALNAIKDPESADTGVLLPLSHLADQLAIGEKYEAIQFGQAGDRGRNRVKIDRSARDRLAAIVRSRWADLSSPAAVAGVLVEADFERMTAHVRTATTELVELIFDEDLADRIYDALRQRSEFEGDVAYDPITNSIKSVRLRRVTRSEQLLLGDEATAFWRDRTAEDLVDEQEKEPVTSFSGLRDPSLSDEEFDSFVAAFD